jgi:CBS domain containing-hemolysin-like protein
MRVWGAVPLREVNETLDLELPEDRFDTLGGYVFGSLNRVAEVGDEVSAEGGTFRVVTMQGRRIEYLKFLPKKEAERDPPK